MSENALFTVDQDARTVRGRLLPFNTMSRVSMSKTAPLRFAKGAVSLPADPDAVTFYLEHDRHTVIGRAVSLEEQDDGVHAKFRVVRTPDGDKWLADHNETAKLSAEVKGIVRGEDDWATAFLTGAAAVKEGAFEGAALFSIDPDPDEDDEKPDVTIEITTDPAPAETEEEEPDEEPDEENEEDAVAEATAPNTMLGSRSRTSADVAPQLTRTGFFAAYNQARKTGDRSALQPYMEDAEKVGLFALSNVKFDGTGGLLTDAAFPGSWLGELWTGKRFERRIVPLLTQKTLTAMSMIGWVWNVKPAMAAWAGNKTAVPSNTPTVTPKSFAATRFAGGHDLAREYYDFNVTEVIDSYADAMVDSYAKLSDAYALTQVTAGATPYTPGANTVNEGLLDIVDGALAVIAAGGSPSWAIVAPDVFKSILATPNEDALKYFSASVGLESGQIGSFPVIPDARLTAGTIIVGDRGGATSWELPGVPIRVSAPDLVLGGVDNAFFGYIGVGVTTPAVVVKNTGVALADTRNGEDLDAATAGVLQPGVLDEVRVAAKESSTRKS